MTAFAEAPTESVHMHPVDASMHSPVEQVPCLDAVCSKVSSGCLSNNREAIMTGLATYSRSGPIGSIVIDDGKANVMYPSGVGRLV